MNTRTYGFSIILVAALCTNLFGAVVYNQWTGGAGTSDWHTASNWQAGYVPDYKAPNGTDDVKAGFKTPGNGPILTASTPLAKAFQITLGGTSGGLLTISGGTLNVAQFITMGANNSPSLENGTLHMTAGTLTCGQGLFVGQKGQGTINMSGGAITLTGNLAVADLPGSIGLVNLSGGSITAADLLMNRSTGANAKINITNDGKIIISGDKRTNVQTFVNAGILTAYNSPASVAVDYGTLNAGKTTIYAVSLKAYNPSPADAAANVSQAPTLAWSAGSGALSHDVYFGTANPPAAIGNQPGLSYTPGSLASNTTYYWRVDEVTASGTVAGDVWSFTTTAGQATEPVPSTGSVKVPTNAVLSWTPGGQAESHNVYFGTDHAAVSNANDPAVLPGRGSTASASYSPGTLDFGTTYYWRIDEVSGTQVLKGQVWSFTTVESTPVYPYLTWVNDPTNSVVVNWWNPNVSGDSTVEYGLTAGYGQVAYNPAVTKYHHVELTGLTPGTIYHYRVKSNDGTVGRDITFKTLPAEPNSYTFVVFGDTRGEPTVSDPNSLFKRHLELCDWLATKDFEFSLHTGDMVNKGTALEDWVQFFHDESALLRSKVEMPVIGNHEVQGGGTVFYYYDLYKQGQSVPSNGYAGCLGKNYSFTYNNAHFVVLSLYQETPGDLYIQRDWLLADLAAAKANPKIKWIFAFMHMPLYTGAHHWSNVNARELWGPIFDQYKVDLIFGAHNHLYERSYPVDSNTIVEPGKGRYYITSGLGGGPFNNQVTTSADAPFFAKWFSQETAAVFVTVSGYNCYIKAIANNGEVIKDSFDIRKDPCILPADFNKDCIVDTKDLDSFSYDWLDSGIWP